MTYQEARRLRDLIRADGAHAVIPRGYRPHNYVIRTFVRGQPFDLETADEVTAYLEESAKHRKASEKAALQLTLPKPRTALDAMIDRACGLS